jgi:hypothetical protein
MKCGSWASFSIHTFTNFYFGCEPKVKVMIAGLWLVAMPFICSFCIAHFTYISMLSFHPSLIQPLASYFFTCECGHGLDAFGMHLVSLPFGGYQIAAHDVIRDTMYVFT